MAGELGSIYQWENEKVISYATRIREIGNRILDSHRRSNQGREDENFVTGFKKDVLDCFIRGLKTDIETRLEDVNTFKDAINNAVEVERKLAANLALRSSHRNREEKLETKKDKIHIMREELICQICNKIGHSAIVCRQLKQNFNYQSTNRTNNWNQTYNNPFQYPRNQNRHYQNQWNPHQQYQEQWKPKPNNRQYEQTNYRSSQYPPNQRNTPYNTYQAQKECSYCKKPGHLINECRKKIYNNQQTQNQQYRPQQEQYQPQQQRFQPQNQGNSRPLPNTDAAREAR
ncbi:uncharacterized protein LOC127286127 [Leptopilina boulardi]|uniref:uncharacterized protein LOC127286127 n=1 Tax=Leptopilina boulardi TaxID=63433 RepID=UPI0021F60E75|nr:uncharacterized protein LOC127286127 [Leptopilina boulardi]